MDTLVDIWKWFPQFTKGDLPSWRAVAIDATAMWFATRKAPVHTELRLYGLHFDDEGGPISIDVELTTYSHTPQLNAHAKLKLDGVAYSMRLQPFEFPTNFLYSTVNTLRLSFLSEYIKPEITPKVATVDVKAWLSDGAQLRFREKHMVLVSSNDLRKPPPPASQSERNNSAT